MGEKGGNRKQNVNSRDNDFRIYHVILKFYAFSQKNKFISKLFFVDFNE